MSLNAGERFVLAVMLFVILAVVTTRAFAGARPLTVCDVCPGYMISKRTNANGGTDVLIRCPGAPIAEPWMTFKDCANPVVKRTADKVTITCDFGPAK
jgi:hypothetical protein